MPYDPRRIRGYHPRYCTCYGCNEARGQQGEKRRQSAADARRRAVAGRQSERKVSESAKEPTLWGEHPPLNTGITMRSASAPQDAMVSPFPWRRRLGGALRLFRLLRSVTATALFCTVLIHVAVFAGILVYVGVQAGAPDGVLPMVADTFTSAREA